MRGSYHCSRRRISYPRKGVGCEHQDDTSDDAADDERLGVHLVASAFVLALLVRRDGSSFLFLKSVELLSRDEHFMLFDDELLHTYRVDRLLLDVCKNVLHLGNFILKIMR